MPKIENFLKDHKKKTSSKDDWDLSSFLSNPKPSTPQRRPGREEVASEANEDSVLSPTNLNKTTGEPQSGIKQVTNGLQTGNKEITENVKSGIKQVTNGLQTGNKEITSFSAETLPTIKQVTQRVTDESSNGVQTDNKQVTNHSFESLRGHEANLLKFIFLNCRSTGSLLTTAITLEQLAKNLNTAKNTSKTIISRLVKKGFVVREMSATGRGGFTRFKLSKELYQAMLIYETDNKQVTNGVQTDNKQGTQRVTQRVTSLPIVVVPNSLSLKTTNTETSNFDTPCFVIPNELSGMVSRRQLSQFVSDEKISEYELQMSLDAFAFDLRNKLVSTKHTANPVGLLIGAIKNNGGYNSQKFAEALKSEMKTALSSQQTLEDSISEAKKGEGWAKYQEIKNSSPEAFQALVAKYEKQGLKGDLLEEFGFLEFQDQERAQKMKLSDA